MCLHTQYFITNVLNLNKITQILYSISLYARIYSITKYSTTFMSKNKNLNFFTILLLAIICEKHFHNKAKFA